MRSLKQEVRDLRAWKASACKVIVEQHDVLQIVKRLDARVTELLAEVQRQREINDLLLKDREAVRAYAGHLAMRFNL